MPLCFDHFEVLEDRERNPVVLGEGGMGKTYKAQDTRLRRFVAIKVIRDALLDNDEARARFFREARMATKIDHPNVAQVLHLSEEDARPCFYAMEFVDGITLGHYLRTRDRLTPVMAMKVAYFVALALEASAHKGVVHRDLKPDNIMLVEATGGDFQVKVIDFGLAKPMQTASSHAALQSGFVGTAAYASPEQIAANEKNLDVRSDIYSLAVTLWHLMTGQLPFAGDFVAVIQKHLHLEPPMQQIERLPEGVQSFLLKSLAKDREARPQSASHLVEEIRHCLESLGAQPPRAVVVRPAREKGVVESDGRGDQYLPFSSHGNPDEQSVIEVQGQRSNRRAVLRRLPGVLNMRLDTAMRRDAKLLQANAIAGMLRVIDVQTHGIIQEHSGGIPLPRLLELWHGDLEGSTFFAWIASMAQALDWSVQLRIKGLSAAIEHWHVDFGSNLEAEDSTNLPMDGDGPLRRIRLDPLGGYDSALAALPLSSDDIQRRTGNYPEPNLEPDRVLREFAATLREMLGGGKTEGGEAGSVASIGPEANEILLDAIAGKYAGWTAVRFVWHLVTMSTESGAKGTPDPPGQSPAPQPKKDGASDPVADTADNPPDPVPPRRDRRAKKAPPGPLTKVLREWSAEVEPSQQLPRLALEEKFRTLLTERKKGLHADPEASEEAPQPPQEPSPRPPLSPPETPSQLLEDDDVPVISFRPAVSPVTKAPESVTASLAGIDPDLIETVIQPRSDYAGAQDSGDEIPPVLPESETPISVASALDDLVSEDASSDLPELGDVAKTRPWQRYRAAILAAAVLVVAGLGTTVWQGLVSRPSPVAGVRATAETSSEPVNVPAASPSATPEISNPAATPMPASTTADTERTESKKLPEKAMASKKDEPPQSEPLPPPPTIEVPKMAELPQPVSESPPPLPPVDVRKEANRLIEILRLEAPKSDVAQQTRLEFKALLATLATHSKADADALEKQCRQTEAIENSLGMIFIAVPGTNVRFSIWETRRQDFEKFTVANTRRPKSQQYRFPARKGSFVPSSQINAKGDSGAFSRFVVKPLDKEKDSREGFWKNPNFKQEPSEPVVCVSWDDANAFCTWLNEVEKKERRKYRLPSDEEWTTAVGPGDFPWGKEFPVPPTAGNYFGSEAKSGQIGPAKKPLDGFSDNFPRTAPVGSFARNAAGIFDLGGNVAEWCGTQYVSELNKAFWDKREWLKSDEFKNERGQQEHFRILRGGSWYTSDLTEMETELRDKGMHDTRTADWGFRCVLEMPPKP